MRTKRADRTGQTQRHRRPRFVVAFRWTLLWTAVLGLSAIIGAVGAPALRKVERAPISEPITPAQLRDVAVLERGVSSAPALHVFGDYQCPACGAFEAATRATLDRLAASGRVRVLYHHATLRGHRLGALAARVVTCSSAHRWSVHTAVYRRAAEWKRAPDPAAALFRIAHDAGVDPHELAGCVEAPETRTRLGEARALADRLGIREVPSVVLDGERLRFPTHRALLRHLHRRLGRP